MLPRILSFSRAMLCAALCLIAAHPALAASCYSDREAEAEQAIRIHSELMVIALNCQHMTPAGQQNLYTQYRNFTNKHASLFAGYERTLISAFSRGGGNGESRLHNLRTRFANDISGQAARQRPDLFCTRYSGRIPAAMQFTDQQIRDWAATPYANSSLSKPRCAGGSR